MRLKVLGLFLIFAASGLAAIQMTVYPSIAPNAFGSPSWTGYAANAMTALENGINAVGDPANDPKAYYQVGSITPQDNIVTGFPSWLGQANPAAPFDSELGNRLHFGVAIQGNGTQFSLSELSFDMSSSDPSDYLGFTGDFSGDDYSAVRVGYIAATNTWVTSGPGTQLVDALYYVGVGNAPDVYNTNPGGTLQDKINNALAGNVDECNNDGPPASTPCYVPQVPYTITTSYTLSSANGAVLATGSATVNVVPEPTSVILLGSVMAFVGFTVRRRKKAAGY